MSAAPVPRPRPRARQSARPTPRQNTRSGALSGSSASGRPNTTLRSYLPSSARARTRRRALAVGLIIVIVVLLAWGAFRVFRGPAVDHATSSTTGTSVPAGPLTASTPDVAVGGSADGIKISTFLGGALRRSYGIGPAPANLDLVWRKKLGSGQTQRKIDNKLVWWAGSGWTGQCTVVRDKGRDYLLIGAYDHNLHKIDARTGAVVWECKFDDVIKSTNTVVANPHPKSDADRLIVVAGSRRGSAYRAGDPRITPLRAVSFTTGKELWRLPVPKTANYSQDVDSSPLLYRGVLYAAVEPGFVYAIDPFATHKVGKHREPTVLKRSKQLFTPADASAHPDLGQANVAIEASPARIGDTLFIASGSGHVYGLKLSTLDVVWDFRTGSDIDGSSVVGDDGLLLQAVEREYITAPGGLFGLDPKVSPAASPQWYFPTENRGIAEWTGGIVGSVAVNDESNRAGSHPRLAAFESVDGSVRVIARDSLTKAKIRGPGPGGDVKVPTLVFKGYIGGGISTPIIVGDTLVAAGYDHKVHMYRIDYREAAAGTSGALRSPSGSYWTVRVNETSTYTAGAPFESTPIVWGGRVYIGCRDGYLYCLGSR